MEVQQIIRTNDGKLWLGEMGEVLLVESERTDLPESRWREPAAILEKKILQKLEAEKEKLQDCITEVQRDESGEPLIVWDADHGGSLGQGPNRSWSLIAKIMIRVIRNPIPFGSDD